MDHYPNIGDIYKWPTNKLFLVVDRVDVYTANGDSAVICLELGTENCYTHIRTKDLQVIGKKVG